jgi:acetylornithine deacetylase
MKAAIEQEIVSFVEERRYRLMELVGDLVRIPSENRAPSGAEEGCQQYIAGVLRGSGWDPVLYTPDDVSDIERHPMYWPGRHYAGRPNIGAVRPGTGGGRSLVLSGHIDTVPAGSAAWTKQPFGGEVEGNRLYGRGSNDMKAGVATNLFVAEALTTLGIRLAGDLTFESVVDEEFGGVNGTLAGRLMGFNADAAIISEPTSLRISPAQRGGRMLHITFTARNAGILASGATAGVIDQLRVFLDSLPEFAAIRRAAAPRHSLYSHLENPVPVTVARISTAPWGTSEPPNVPDTCRLELFWQAMPGETLEQIDAQFFEWFEGLLTSNASIFCERPHLEHPIRWLPGSAIAADNPLVSELAAAVNSTLGFQPVIAGIEGPCDMYAFHEFGIPTVLWGPRGGNTHMPDEYVEIDSLVQSAKALLAFVCSWCGGSTR